MPAYKYSDYAVLDSDNQQGSGVTRFPEGWDGRKVNNCMAALASAVRNLGDAAAKLPVDSDGNPDASLNAGRIGTAAFQNINTFFATGGKTHNRSRKVKGKDIRLFWGTTADAAGEEQYGWAICDGRVVNGVTTPDMRGRLAGFYSTSRSPASFYGSNSSTTDNEGGQEINGWAADYELQLGEVPVTFSTRQVESGGGATVKMAEAGSAAGHSHTIEVDDLPQHNHDFRFLAEHVTFVPLMYVGD